MSKTKFIEVNEFIDKSSANTVKDLCDELKAAPAADVIPIPWVESWYREHYRTNNAALLEDWRRANDG